MRKIVCTSCGFTGEPSTVTKAVFIELVLWLCLLIPASFIQFGDFHLSTKRAKCQQNTIIPVESPMGMKFLKENLPDQYSANFEKKYEVNKNGVAWKLGKLVKKILK